MRTRVMAIAISIVAVLGAALIIAPPAQAAAADKGAVFSLTNAQRVKAGAKPLISDPALSAAAQAWAAHLARTCSFSHSTSSWRANRTAKAGWTGTGENIAAGQTTASAVMSAWMGSGGHKRNLLNAGYTGMGVGYATSACGYRHYWVQIFGVGKTAGPAGAGDTNDDHASDVVAQNSAGDLMVYRGSGTSRFLGGSVVDTSWQSGHEMVPLGDFTGDGIADLGRIAPNGDFHLQAGTGRGTYGTATKIGNGWGVFTDLIGGLDFNGDGRVDVLGRTSNGLLRLYRGNGTGGWIGGSGQQIGNGWNVVNEMFYAGDFTGDGRGDVLARWTNGTLHLYPSTGRGAWGAARQIGTGWGAMLDLFSPGDFTGDGKPDVIGRHSNGRLYLYHGNGRGGWGTSGDVIGTGWSGMLQLD